MRAKPYRLSLSHPWPDYRGRHIVVVTGDRHGRDEAMVEKAMSAVARYLERIMVFHGACRGYDTLVDAWCSRLGVPVARFEAIWIRNGRLDKQAGPKRNGAMVARAAALAGPGRSAILVAFPGRRGTVDCMQAAVAHGLPVYTIAETRVEKIPPGTLWRHPGGGNLVQL